MGLKFYWVQKFTIPQFKLNNDKQNYLNAPIENLFFDFQVDFIALKNEIVTLWPSLDNHDRELYLWDVDVEFVSDGKRTLSAGGSRWLGRDKRLCVQISNSSITAAHFTQSHYYYPHPTVYYPFLHPKSTPWLYPVTTKYSVILKPFSTSEKKHTSI